MQATRRWCATSRSDRRTPAISPVVAIKSGGLPADLPCTVTEGLANVGHTLRVLSSNLWNGNADPDAFAELVSSLAVDIAAVQEVSPEQAEALSSVMPYGRLEPTNQCTGMGLVARVPFEADRVALPTRDAHVARFAPGDFPDLQAPLEVINVHITAPHVLPPGVSVSLRRRQWRILEDFLAKPAGGGRLMIGDFNATPAWPFYRSVVSHLDDAAVLVAEARGRKPLRTWGPTPRSPRLLRIDHAFVAGIAVDDFQVLPVAGADHSAIVVDLRLS